MSVSQSLCQTCLIRSILDLVSVLFDLLVDGLDGWGVLNHSWGWDSVLALDDWGGSDGEWGSGKWGWDSLHVLGWQSSLDQRSLGWQSSVQESWLGSVGTGKQAVDGEASVEQTGIQRQGTGDSGVLGEGKS